MNKMHSDITPVALAGRAPHVKSGTLRVLTRPSPQRTGIFPDTSANAATEGAPRVADSPCADQA
jgi:hypothetical protein